MKPVEKDLKEQMDGPVILGKYKGSIFLTKIGTGLKSSMLEHIKVTAKKNGGKLVNEFTDEVTHVVTVPDKDGATKRTIKYALGVLKGAWILSYDCKSFLLVALMIS